MSFSLLPLGELTASLGIFLPGFEPESPLGGVGERQRKWEGRRGTEVM